MKLSMVFYLQTDNQTQHMNQELEQYLWFFMDYRQKDWLKQLAIAKFVVNSQVHIATKISPFIANYSQELRIGTGIRRRGKIESL